MPNEDFSNIIGKIYKNHTMCKSDSKGNCICIYTWGIITFANKRYTDAWDCYCDF